MLLASALIQRLSGQYDQISVVGWDVGSVAVQDDFEILARRKRQFVMERYRLENGIDFMVTVGSFAKDSQTRIDLCE